MTILRIKDKRHGILLDLDQVMDALGPDFTGCNWIIRDPENDDPFQAVGPGGIELENLARRSASICDSELRNLLRTTTQIIWGGFIPMSKRGGRDFLLRIEIIDSSYYELTTHDERLIDRLIRRFHDIERVG